MTTATVTVPFATASPAELREAILPEDVDQFDRGYREALDAARDTLRLDDLESFLNHWRLNARLVNHRGHDHWRDVLARADYLNTHGHPPSGTVTYTAEESRQRLLRRLAQA